MKRLFACLLAAALLLSMAACGGEPPAPTDPTAPSADPTAPEETAPTEPEVALLSVLTGSHYQGEWSEDYVALGWVEWESLLLDEVSAAAYPLLASALEDWNSGAESGVQEILQTMRADAAPLAAELGHDFQGFREISACRVQRADSRILSVRLDCRGEDARGAFSRAGCLNLDPATGEAVSIHQVVTDPGQLPGLLEEALKAKYGADAPAADAQTAPEDWLWTLGYQGMTFYIGSDALSENDRHGMSVTLLFADHPGLFAESFLDVPAGGYAVALSDTGVNDLDLIPGDGQQDQLSLTLEEMGGLWIDLNGQIAGSADYYGYELDAWLVTADGQRFWLYIDTISDNDYHTFHVYDLSGTAPVSVATLHGDGFAGRIIGSTWYQPVFNNPARFTLNTRTNLLGTLSASRTYSMDPATGIPQPERGYYTISADSPVLVSRIDLELEMLPGHEKALIPAGTEFRYMRTDNERYVDMLLEDGRECRIQVTFEGWRGMINGIAEDECFDGIMYAG